MNRGKWSVYIQLYRDWVIPFGRRIERTERKIRTACVVERLILFEIPSSRLLIYEDAPPHIGRIEQIILGDIISQNRSTNPGPSLHVCLSARVSARGKKKLI